MENNTRLQIKPKTLKKLFAYSGNQCAFNGCARFLVDDGGTMLGKIAHIRSPVSGGPRYDPDWSSERCREPENLMILCGDHHDIIDDEDRVDEFPVALLEGYKKRHEARFQRAEQSLIDKYTDHTAADNPTYPVSLAGLAAVYDLGEEMVGNEDEISGVQEFADRLSNMSLEDRMFAYRLTNRMKKLKKPHLNPDDVESAFRLETNELLRLIEIQQEHGMCDLGDDNNGRPVIVVCGRSPAYGECNPFEEIYDYCEKTGTDEMRFLRDLDFRLFDE